MLRQIRKKYKPSTKLAVRNILLWRDKHRCVYCGIRINGQKFHADHQYAYSRGGKTHVDNLVVACGPCNMKKSYLHWRQSYPAAAWRRVVAVVMYLPHVRLVDFL